MNKLQEFNDKLISSMDERDKLLATIGLWSSWGAGLATLVYAILLFIYGLYIPAIIWAVWMVFFVLVPIINIRAGRLLSWTTTLFLFMALVTPFLVDYMLGGFSRLGYSAFVIVAVVMANLFQRNRIIFWTSLGTVMLVISILIEPGITLNPRLPNWMSQAWNGGSTITSLWMVALMLYYFIHQRDRALDLLAVEQEKLRQMATSDPLTGPFNRRHFFDQGEQVHQMSIRYQHPYSVLMIDLDDFKRVNDTYSHAAGDEVLRETARRLRGIIRAVDTLGRYGGEEFTILLPETNLNKAEQTAERLLESLRSTPMNIGPTEVTITASIGVAQSEPSAPEPFHKLVERADHASYRAKGLGKNRVVLAE